MIPTIYQLLLLFVTFHDCKENTLQLVITVFRHGDRTGDVSRTYPKNPYINETYFPFGPGQLVPKGKKRLYKLGQIFKKNYKDFIGSFYHPGLIESTSTDYSRAQCSLQLFLAGLFPPSDTELHWNKNLNWNPIPYKIVPFEDNQIMTIPVYYCPKYQLLYDAYQSSPEALAIEDIYKPYYSYISEETGLNITSVLDLFDLYFDLSTEEEWGLQLPEWSYVVYPNYLTGVMQSIYEMFIATPELKQLFGGFLVKKIIKDMYLKIDDAPNQPKMYIYSGHEASIVAVLGVLNLFFPHIPNYGSSVTLELHEIEKGHYVRVLYNQDVADTFVEMTIPECEIMCPLEKFVNLVKENLPEDGESCIVKEV